MSAEWDHVILLTADALRADHLSSYGYHRETSPTLDRLGTRNVRFTNAHSASSHTREAVPSLLTGHHPGTATESGYRLGSQSIASKLSEAGFDTAGFHSNPFLSRAYGFDRGFDTFDDDLHLGQHRLLALAQRALDKLRNRHYARASEINDRALHWIDSRDSETPFFLWNHYMDTHGPYQAPNDYRTAYRDEPVSDDTARSLYQRAIDDPDSISDAEHSQLIDLYDGEIRYLDHSIGNFLDALRTRGLLERSLLVFSADHGDAFGEDGYYEHPRYLDESLTHVPLLVRTPGEESATVATPTSTLDIPPTVLSAESIPTETLPGVDLRAIAADPDAFEDRLVFASARGDGADRQLRRFSVHSEKQVWFAAYDSERQELETDCENETVLETLQEHVASQDDVASETAADTDSAEINLRLRGLGYK